MILLKNESGAGGKNLRSFCGLLNGSSDHPIRVVLGLCPRRGEEGLLDNHSYARFVPGPRFGQSMPGICAPTTTVERYTNLGCSPTTCTTPPRRFWGRWSVLQLWSSDTLSDLTFAWSHTTAHLECLLCQGFAVHPPLWLEHWFDDISGFTVCQKSELCSPLTPCAYLQMGICIGLSLVSTKRPASLRAATTATLA